MILPSQRSLFDIPTDVAYFNCAYMSPLLNQAIKDGIRGLTTKSHPWKITSTDFFTDVERVRNLAALIIGCHDNNIALVPSTSYGIATAINNIAIKPSDEILILEHQFPSNVHGWHEAARSSKATVRTVPHSKDGNWTNSLLRMIHEKTKVVAIPHCHWSDGGLINLSLIASALREIDAYLVIDATQSLGVMPLDIAAIKPDYVVASCYKWLLGPYSTAIMYVAPQHLDGTPIEHGWANRLGAEDFTSLANYKSEFQIGARRFDMGERSNFALLPALAVALQQILDWGIDTLYETISQMTSTIATQTSALGFRAIESNQRAGHFLGLTLHDKMLTDIVDELAKQKIFISKRGKTLRITPHVYNNSSDINRLCEALALYV
ncbi:MAG: aminotransferase [Acidiferrobacteraceae bacterium]|nr:aminotransferase [Acidiferrobacteraceae bacterium]|tara:strand:- start:1439 stop:2575 length:1137 start_codon:yes stop_codon:yes gene_type:complete